MPVVFLITIAAVLVGIFFAATGRGGELAYEHADHAPLDLGPVSAADIALLRPPTALWGYNMQVTDEALEHIARAMRERDVTIAYLQEQLAGYERNGRYPEPKGAHARHAPYAPPAPTPVLGATEAAGAISAQEVPAAAEAQDVPEAADARDVPEAAEAREVPETSELRETSEVRETSENPEIPEDPGASQAPEAPDPPEAPQTPEAPETLEPPAAPDVLEPLESPEPPIAAESPAATQAPKPPQAPKLPQTPLVLKASGPKPPPAPEPHEATQPSRTLQDRNEDHEATQPSATVARDEGQGPQGSFDTYGWWAEQQRAARDEQARPQVAGDKEATAGQEDDALAAAEEQGW